MNSKIVKFAPARRRRGDRKAAAKLRTKRKFDIDEICAIFQVPLHMVGA